MGKPKLHPVTQVLNLLDALSDDEKRIIYDRVRPAPKPRQKGKGGKSAQKRKASGNTLSTMILKKGCVQCGLVFDDNVHHKITATGYHEFVEPVGEASKGVGV